MSGSDRFFRGKGLDRDMQWWWDGEDMWVRGPDLGDNEWRYSLHYDPEDLQSTRRGIIGGGVDEITKEEL